MTLEMDVQPLPLEMHDDVVRISGTRITLDTVLSAYLEGDSAEEIVEEYPTLDLGDIYAVIGYYLKNRYDVEEYLLARRAKAVAVRKENESRFPPAGLRERLLA